MSEEFEVFFFMLRSLWSYQDFKWKNAKNDEKNQLSRKEKNIIENCKMSNKRN